MLESRRGIGLGDGMMCCCWAYGHWDAFLLDEKTRLLAGNAGKSKGNRLGRWYDVLLLGLWPLRCISAG